MSGTLSAIGYATRVRVARVEHRCYDCGKRICPGQRYTEAVASPRYDFNPRPGHWTRGAFCIALDA